MDKEKIEVCILLINDKDADVEKIKTHLNETMRLSWTMVHCTTVKEAVSHISEADVILLDLNLDSPTTALEDFEVVEHLIFEIPIIALTGDGQDEHELATTVMELGAADNIIRGKFGRLVDAIEFSLIRQKLKTDKRKHSAQVLANTKEKGAANLKVNKEKEEANLQLSDVARRKDQEKSKQMLRMFTGDYAVDKD